METSTLIANIGYLISISMFVMGIKQLGKIKTARNGNLLAAGAMLLAIISQLVEMGQVDYTLIIAGVLIGSVIGMALAIKVEMTAMPQLVAVFNGFGGAASGLVALALFFGSKNLGPLSVMDIQGFSGMPTAVTMVLSVVIGFLTLTGSIVAYLKLSDVFGKYFGKPTLLPMRHFINLALLGAIVYAAYMWVGVAEDPAQMNTLAYTLTGLSLVLGILLVIPIGGADMPVVISLLNSYSGIAASATGFALNSNVLIVSGALVGASGIILTQIMCKAMNRSLANVMLGGFGADDSATSSGGGEYVNIKSAEAEEAAMDFDGASSVIIVPGYGLAVAQGQNACKELGEALKKRGCSVKYAIHPVAGRMPGHMNVLLAESNVPYDELYEMDNINNDFQNTDIALIIGANDVVNPAAKDDKTSPLYGMPVLNVDDARMVFVIKRGMGAGFSGVKNTLFEKDNTRMIFGDAKKVLEGLVNELKEN